jgi:nucleoside-diphosphate-sugar epimerase
MRVFAAGATGAIGRWLIPQLTAAGHEVTAMTRSPAKADGLRALGAEPVIADGLDAAATTRAVGEARPDAVVRQMTALAGKPDLRHFDRWFATTNELRTKGTDNLLAAAREAGVDRFIAQSYTGWTNLRRGERVKSEDDGYDPDPAKWQRESLAAIRYLEQAVPAGAPTGIVLRYGTSTARGRRVNSST